ncbi:MAG TPA: hypothetical protein VKE69_05520, partial [Planctomycetota bacterium]|nr:hypothetical protein [Planctomycetota bacterium]
MINVREVLNAHSYSTTLRELEAKGRAKVRVINAKEIADLIEQAVRHTIAKAQDGDGLKALVEKSKVEFAELKRQRDAEKAAREGGLLELAEAKKELSSMREEFQRLRQAEVELATEKGRVEESRRLIEALSKERDEARAAATGASPSGAANELLEKLASEVAKLQQKMDAPVA